MKNHDLKKLLSWAQRESNSFTCEVFTCQPHVCTERLTKSEHYTKRIKTNPFKSVPFTDEFDWFVKFGVALIKGSNWKGTRKRRACKNQVLEYHWWSKRDTCKRAPTLMFIMETLVLNKPISYIRWQWKWAFYHCLVDRSFNCSC